MVYRANCYSCLHTKAATHPYYQVSPGKSRTHNQRSVAAHQHQAPANLRTGCGPAAARRATIPPRDDVAVLVSASVAMVDVVLVVVVRVWVVVVLGRQALIF